MKPPRHRPHDRTEPITPGTPGTVERLSFRHRAGDSRVIDAVPLDQDSPSRTLSAAARRAALCALAGYATAQRAGTAPVTPYCSCAA